MKTKTTLRNAKLDAIITCLKQGMDVRQATNSVREQFPTLTIHMDYVRRVKQAMRETKSANLEKISEFLTEKRKGNAERRASEQKAAQDAVMKIGFDFLTDDALIGELRRRGYTGTITKTISTTL